MQTCEGIIKAMSEIQLLPLMVGVVSPTDCVWIYGCAASKHFFITPKVREGE